MFVVGIAAGFRFSTDAGRVIAGIAVLLLLGYAFSWVFAFIGLTASSPEASNAYGFTILFPLTFISSAFVPVGSMPGWLRLPAEENSTIGRVLRTGAPARIDDWGKVLGDTAAVTAMLDRLLHHGHLLKCGPRSWRTKTQLPGDEQNEKYK